jgi:hypothetical protein
MIVEAGIKPGDKIILEPLGDYPGPQWLDGRMADGTVGLAPNAGEGYPGTWWMVYDGGDGAIMLECQADLPGPRWLDGHSAEGAVGLAPATGADHPGTRWMAHDCGDGYIALECLDPLAGPKWLAIRTEDGTPGLAPEIGESCAGTWWMPHEREPMVTPVAAFVIDSRNVLTDFDMCLALAQKAVNSQMEYAWKAWKRRCGFQDSIDIFKLKREGRLVDSHFGLSVRLAPLRLSLNVESGKQGQVMVTLPLPSGKVVYFDELAEGAAEYAIQDWSVSFVTDLDKKPVDLDILAQIDPDAHQAAQQVIQNSGLSEDVFSIEYLFLKLTDVNLLLSDNKNIAIPPEVPGPARDKALSCLNFLLQGDMGEFMLGTVVRRNTRESTPTFALTDFIFDVHADWSAPEASTLSYLGEFSGRELPADLDAARIQLKDAWVRPEMLDGTAGLVSGVMAIRKGVFMDGYLLPTFPPELGRPTPSSALTWHFHREDFKSDASKDIIRREYNWGWALNLDLSILPGSNRLSLVGQIYAKALMDGYTLAPWDWLSAHTEWIHYEGTSDISAIVELSGEGSSTDFKTRADLKFDRFGDWLGPVQVTNSTIRGGAHVLDAFGSLFGSSPSESLAGQMSGILGAVRTWIDTALDRIDIDISQQAFIPPGGGVFTFQNLRFSDAGDLIFDVIYQAP